MIFELFLSESPLVTYNNPNLVSDSTPRAAKKYIIPVHLLWKLDIIIVFIIVPVGNYGLSFYFLILWQIK